MMTLRFLLFAVFAVLCSSASIDPPNRTGFNVQPGQVTEVRLELPKQILGMTWTYHIRLTSTEEFTPVMWLGFPIYLPDDLKVTPEEECELSEDVPAFRTHHILQVAYREEGYFVKMTNFLGNETNEVLLAKYPEILLFSTNELCYTGEMLVYETVELYVRPSKKRSGMTHDHENAHDHAHHDHDHGADGSDSMMQKGQKKSGPLFDYQHFEDNRPIQAKLEQEAGRGEWQTPTPVFEDGTSWIPAIVVGCIFGSALLYFVIKELFGSKSGPKPKDDDEDKA